VVFRDEADAWTYIDRHRKGDSVCVNYDPENTERSPIEPGTVRIGKYLAAGIAFLLLGVLALEEKGVCHRTSDISTTMIRRWAS
jgi:hypothetical protein